MKQQEDADAEYALQLSEEFSAEYALASASASTHDANPVSSDRYGDNNGDDMDSVLEEIAKMDAQERLQASGHAYNGKLNINHVLADEDVEEARIREKVIRETKLLEWREERGRQDAEFAAMEENDRLLALSKKANVIETSIPEPAPAPAPALEVPDELEPEQKPLTLTKEALRRARLAFFTTTNPQKS